MRLKIVCLFLIIGIFSYGQEKIQIDSINTTSLNAAIENYPIVNKNPLKAGLYSAVLPGLGQVYNQKYWKVPIVWGLIGTGIGMTMWYNKKYEEYHQAFVAEINREPHKFSGIYNENILAAAQDAQLRYKNYAIAGTILAYILNILDATVDAHLFEVRRDKDLKINPVTIYDPSTGTQNMGIGIQLSLK